MDGFLKEVLARLPLADGSLSLLVWVLEAQFLGAVFENIGALVGIGVVVSRDGVVDSRRMARAQRERASSAQRNE